MDNWLANIVGDVDSLHVEIDNLNDLLVGLYFIKSINNTCKLPVWTLNLELICIYAQLANMPMSCTEKIKTNIYFFFAGMVGLSITYTTPCVAMDYFSLANGQHKYKIISRKYSSSISLIFLQSVHATKYIRSLISYPKSIDAKNQYSLLIEKERCFKFLYQKLRWSI
jgi:hypothetical protein